MAKPPEKLIPEDLEAVLLDALAPLDPGVAAAGRMRARLIERITATSSSDRLHTVAADTGDWIEPVPGNRIKVLRDDDATMSMLVRLEPGTTFPKHYHPEDEETFVVEGETWFGDIHLVAGDYHLAPKGTTHGEVRTDTGCLLLIRKASD